MNQMVKTGARLISKERLPQTNPSYISTCTSFQKEFSHKQKPWRLPSRQAEFDGTNRLRLDVHSDDQAVTGNQGYFED